MRIATSRGSWAGSNARESGKTKRRLQMAGLCIVFVWFFFGGIAHFLFTDALLGIVPPYVPYPLAAIYLSGVLELLGSIAILPRRTRTAAGNGLILLTICVTPANLYMWMNPQLFPRISETVLGLRLLIQVLLIGCIWWSTRQVAHTRKWKSDFWS